MSKLIVHAERTNSFSNGPGTSFLFFTIDGCPLLQYTTDRRTMTGNTQENLFGAGSLLDGRVLHYN